MFRHSVWSSLSSLAVAIALVSAPFAGNLTAQSTELREGHTVHHRRLDDAELTAGEEDIFSGGNFTFSFERDRNGQLIGFYLSNGRTRDVRFERLQIEGGLRDV
jgi:hypothetical protein